MREMTNKEIIEALEKHSGFVSFAAKELGCCRQTLAKIIKNSIKLEEAKNSCRESFKDLCESKLKENVEANKEASIIFALKTQARDRGYIERQDINIDGRLSIPQLKPQEAKEVLGAFYREGIKIEESGKAIN